MMNARSQPPFPPNPQPGQKWGAWTWSGGRWVCTRLQGVFTNVQVFTQSAPYTPTPGLTSLTVECIGGGGAGGAAGPIPADTFVVAGGGGGSGGYSRVTLSASLVLGGVNVTIGDGGVALYNGSEQSGSPTSFGAFCVANGGGFGLNNNGTSVWGLAGTGGAPGVGDVAFPGSSGENGVMNATAVTGGFSGGIGGVVFGGNRSDNMAGPGSANGGLAAWPNTGAGGTGAIANQVDPVVTPLFSGGDGASGICIVTETCWADTGDEGDCGCGPGGQARIAAWPGGFDND